VGGVAAVAARRLPPRVEGLERSASPSQPPAEPRPAIASFQLQQVLLNLVANAQDALRHAAAPRSIVVAGVANPEHAIVEVRDTGPGIPAETRARIFEPFFTTKAQGTGLGLAIAAGIVQNADGVITVDNPPSGGAVFRLTFPIAPPVADLPSQPRA
jgi:two-component system sensor histidine kinase HydH